MKLGKLLGLSFLFLISIPVCASGRLEWKSPENTLPAPGRDSIPTINSKLLEMSGTSAAELFGRTAWSRMGEEPVGEMVNLVVDRETGELAFIIVAANGRFYPVPANAVNYQPDTRKFVLNLDGREFFASPNFATREEIPDLDNRRVAVGLSRFYGVEPLLPDRRPGAQAKTPATADLPNLRPGTLGGTGGSVPPHTPY